MISEQNDVVRETILIVEDELLVAMELESKLQSFGYNTFIAHDGESAVKIIKENTLDLILMDIILEGDITGIDVIEKIQNDYPVPVIYLTALVDDNTISQAKNTLPFGYIVKPYNDVELKATIGLALHKALMEKKFHDSELKYRNLVEKAGIAILIDDLEGNLRYCNLKFAKIFGYSLPEIREMSIIKLAHPDDLDFIMDYHKKRINSENPPDSYVARGIHKDGSIRYLQIIANSFMERGEILGTKSYIWDISERMYMQEKLKDSEELFRLIIEQSNDGIILLNQKGVIVEWNKGQEKITGFSRDEVMGKRYSDIQFKLLKDELRTRETKEFIHNNLKNFFMKADAPWLGKLQEITIIGKDKKKKHLQQMPFMIKTADSFLLCNISRDVSDQFEVNRLLRKSECNYRRLFETNFEAILISDMNDRILKANPAAAKMLGFNSPENMVGMKIEKLYKNPDLREEHFKSVTEKGIINEFKIEMKKADGSDGIVTIIGSAVLIEDFEDNEKIAETMFIDISRFIR